jgi:hypothetical protein
MILPLPEKHFLVLFCYLSLINSFQLSLTKEAFSMAELSNPTHCLKQTNKQTKKKKTGMERFGPARG